MVLYINVDSLRKSSSRKISVFWKNVVPVIYINHDFQLLFNYLN